MLRLSYNYTGITMKPNLLEKYVIKPKKYTVIATVNDKQKTTKIKSKKKKDVPKTQRLLREATLSKPNKHPRMMYEI